MVLKRIELYCSKACIGGSELPSPSCTHSHISLCIHTHTHTRIPICIFGRLEKIIRSFFVCSVVQVEKSCGHWCGVIDSHVNLQMLDKNLQQRCSVYLRNQHLAYAFSFPGTQTLSEHLQSFLSLVIMCFGCPDYLEFPTLKTCLSLPLHVSPPRNVPFVHWFIDWKLPSQLVLLISRYRVSFPSFVPQYLAL